MSFTDCHTFHGCPLRSSSLLIVSKEKQTIITATDEVFDILGYEPTELVGRSINILDPRQQFYYDGGEKKERFTLCHESLGQLPFEICIHHDPLTNATDLDYWLIRPVNMLRKKPSSPFTILRLSPFGTIEHAYPSTQFPQQTRELKGHPIMSFVHESDVRPLCDKLCNIRRRTHQTFRVRWLNLLHPKESHNDQDFEWVSLTVMNSPRKKSCDAAYDPQSRPICIIRPDPPCILEKPQKECQSSYLTPYLLTGLVSGTVRLLWEGTSLGVNTFLEVMEAMHDAMDHGKTYIIEYLAHILTYSIKMMNEIIYFSSLDDFKQEQNQEQHKNTTKKKKQLNLDDRLLLEEKKKKYHLYGLSSIKVSIENNIWSVPLYINKTIKSSSYLTDNKSLRKQKKN